MREYFRVDGGDVEEQESPFIEVWAFTNEEEDPEDVKLIKSQIPLEGSSEVYDLDLSEHEEPTQEQLESVFNAKPYILNVINPDDSMVTVLSSTEENRLYYVGFSQEIGGTIIYIKIENTQEDGYVIEPYEYRLSQTAPDYTPTSIELDEENFELELSQQDIEDILDHEYLVVAINFESEHLHFNLVTIVDDDNHSKSLIYSCPIVQMNITLQFTVSYEGLSSRIINNDIEANPELEGNEDVLTGLEIYGTKYAIPSGGSDMFSANVTFAQDYSKVYFSSEDLTYLKSHEPLMIKTIWNDGEGHSGAFVLYLSTTQEGGQANMPRTYSCVLTQMGQLQVATLEIDSSNTVAGGSNFEIYTVQ